jgi:DNA-binding transcriptional ArsR family regulator
MLNPPTANTIAEIAALIGDPTRASILSALMDGRAFTASELAWHAGVGAPTTSAHLAKMEQSGLIALRKQGRHRYYRLASADVAQAMERLMGIAASAPARLRTPGPRDRALRRARTCYDHLAGELGVGIADSLARAGHLDLGDEAGTLTPSGTQFLQRFGIALPQDHVHCRACLDWSERRSHLAGQVGRLLYARLLELGWIERRPDSRAIQITGSGHEGLSAAFGLHLTDG